MEGDTLERLKRSAAVPSMPQIITRFLEITENPEFSHRELVDVLGKDPGMAGDVLRLANSAFFGVTKQINSLRQAMTLLGIKRVRSLVLGRYMVDNVGKSLTGPIDVGYFWRRSVATAVLATKFVGAVRPASRDVAFVSGLLADIGVIIMAEGFGDEYDDVARQYSPGGREDICELEQRQFGVTHADVSAMVLEHWKLPRDVCEVVAHHHDRALPDGFDCDVYGVARAVNGAGIMGKLLSEHPEEEVLPDKCREATELAGFDPQALATMLDEIEIEVRELAAVLRVDVIPSGVYELVARVVRQKLPVPT